MPKRIEQLGGKIGIHDPIAIVGMGCRYPQAEGVDALWRLLLEGRDAIAPYPGGRFRGLDAVYAEAAKGSRVIATQLGGFLPEVDRFDAAFFGISPREAGFIDPQQRLLMEVSWDALEDAGQVRERYEGSRTGVFVGMWTTDYENHIYRNSEKPEFYLLTGGGRSTASGRLSFAFGFEGPSVSVDTACSSSMVAIHLACQSLRQRECDMALGGGVNVILSSDVTRLFSNAGMLAGDGHCKFGDRSANGFVRSEGAGVVVLKRLADAEAEGDSIYAVIRGSAVNNDGCSSGLLVTPSRVGQQRMLLEAWQQAGIGGNDLSYIEAHGTGTHVGDPVELGAISDALQATGVTERVLVGSLKTNIGHTESAAGVAGVIKAALVLRHGMAPGSLHHHEPNPEIDWAAGVVEVAAETRELKPAEDGAVRMAGASSFGLTGTNAHMVLAEYVGSREAVPAIEVPATLVLPLTAYSAEALKKNAARWIEFLGGEWSAAELAEVCWRAGARRTHLPHRLAAVGSNAVELRAQLQAFLDGDVSNAAEAGVAGNGAAKVVFVAPGQGSQWDGMARDLMRESEAFLESFTACDRAIAAETGWSLMERLESAQAATYLTEIDFVQPALFAMSVALAAVWQAAGVTAGALVGHSMGEVAAAYLAGALSLEDAAAVICRRSRLMRRLSGSGAMASVELPAAELEKWLQPLDGKVSIAAENSPGNTVISGDAAAVDQLLEWLELKEIFCRRVKVDVASHSSQVDPILQELEAQLGHLQPRAGTLPLFSTVTGAYADGNALGAGYWVSNLRQPVRLAKAVSALAGEGFNCFVELSPHPILAPALEGTLRVAGAEGAVVLPSMLRGAPASATVLRSVVRSWIAGGRLNWSALAGRPVEEVSKPAGRRLPEYVFERESFWPDEGEAVAGQRTAGAIRLSPLVLSRTDLASEPGTILFAVNGDTHSLPYLKDHRVGGSIVFPAAAHLEAVLEAARIIAPDKTAVLSEIAFLQALYLSEDDASELQLVLRRLPGTVERYRFSLMGRQAGGEGSWTEHSTGSVELTAEARVSDRFDEKQEAPVERRGNAEEHYRRALRGGLEYGPAFQRVASFGISRTASGARSTVVLRGFNDESDNEYRIHPALLDNCFQAMLPLFSHTPGVAADDVYLPLAVRSMWVHSPLTSASREEQEKLVAHATLTRVNAVAGTMEFNLRLSSASGAALLTLEGMTVQRVSSKGGERVAENLYELTWTQVDSIATVANGSGIGRHFLIFADWNLHRGTEASAGAELARALTLQGGRSTVVWAAGQFRALGAGERRLDLLGVDEYELPVDDMSGLERLLGLVAAEAGRIGDVVDLWTAEAARQEAQDGRDLLQSVMDAQGIGAKFIPQLVQVITRAGWAAPPRLWVVTRGTQNLPDAPPTQLAGATAWGLGSVLMREHPELAPALVDLGATGDPRELEQAARLILQTGENAKREDRIGLRGDKAYVARLRPSLLPNEEEHERALADGEAFAVEIGKAGALDELHLRVIEQRQPGAGEVLLEVAHAGLNFIDVAKALGIYPGLDPDMPVALGAECSGRVIATGMDVTHVRAGDAVMAISPSLGHMGLLASRAVLPGSLVLPVPEGLSLQQAAAAPIAYLTAYYSLHEIGRLRRGEWVLIHAGAGGVGLAAAKIALECGARVIATASSPEKHAYLHSWGVEHVLTSRSLEFADGVMEITGGRGVDVVLNSLAGDFISKSLDVLAPYGRFVELGKRDVYDDKRVGLKAFRNNISYTVVDLAALIEDKPEYAAEMLRQVVEAIAAGRWAVPPVTVFRASDAAGAFQFMTQGKHIGKLVLEFESEAAGERDAVMVLPRRKALEPIFKRDATYVITGGLGGVGLAVAEWMAANGAGHLVLVSRRESGAAEKVKLAAIRELGAVVYHRRVDLLDRVAVGELADEIQLQMPPLRGIVHAAAIIEPALIMDLTPQRFDSVLEPKLRGSWNLHEATLGLDLDFFVMFSSIASLLPMPGHGNYSAANAFQDAFAGYRRGLGLAACSIDWAVWLNMGMAQQSWASQTIDAYRTEGFHNFDRDEALRALELALRINPVHVAAIGIDAEEVRSAWDVVPPLLRDLVKSEEVHSKAAHSTLSALAEVERVATQKERIAALVELLRGETSRVLKLSVDKVGANQRFGQMGIDSLMALELVRRVNGALGLALPATAVFNYPSPLLLAEQILKRLRLEVVQEDSTAQMAFETGESAVPAESISNAGRNERSYSGELTDEDAMRALLEPGESTHGY